MHKQLNALRRPGAELAGVELGDPCEDDIYVLSAHVVGPEGCPYDGGRFALRLTFTEDYPQRPPRGVFTTPIFHPNVSPTTGDICVSVLQRDWQPAHGLAHVLLALRSLLVNPNAESALNEAAGRLLLEDYPLFCARAALMAQIHAGAPVREGEPCPMALSDNKDDSAAREHVSKPAVQGEPKRDAQNENAARAPAPKKARRL
jgi:ubiquitin-protein ligase